MKLVVKEGKKTEENLKNGKIIFVVDKFDYKNEEELELLNLLNKSMEQAKAPVFFDVMDDDKIRKQDFHKYMETGYEINKGSLLYFSKKYLSCFVDFEDEDFNITMENSKHMIRQIIDQNIKCWSPYRMGLRR